MGTYTTNNNLYKPTVGEHDWGVLVNANFDKIDEKITNTSINNVIIDTEVVNRSPVYFNGTKWVLATSRAVGFYDEANDAVITAGYLDGFTGLTPGAIVGNRGVALTATEIVILETPIDNTGVAQFVGDVSGYLLRKGVVSASSGALVVPASSSVGNNPVTVNLNLGGDGTYAIIDHTLKCYLDNPCSIPIVFSVGPFTHVEVSPSAKSYTSANVEIDSISESGNLNIYGAAYIVLIGGFFLNGSWNNPSNGTMAVADTYIDAGLVDEV